jgi:hypothetical protein
MGKEGRITAVRMVLLIAKMGQLISDHCAGHFPGLV